MQRIVQVLVVCTLLFSALTGAQVPHKISYQGMLTTSSGAPVIDGPYNVTISLYNTPTGGTPTWGPVMHTGVPVSRGSFSILLGSVGGPLPSDLFTQPPQPLYVEVTASGPGISGSVTFSPRSELSSVPYSLAPWASNGSNIIYNSGNVGIGPLTFPTQSLDAIGTARFRGMTYQNDSDVVVVDPDGVLHRHTIASLGLAGDPVDDWVRSPDPNTGPNMYPVSGVYNVGIGTTTPQGILDVHGGTVAGADGRSILLSAESSTSGAGGSLNLVAGSGGPGGGTVGGSLNFTAGYGTNTGGGISMTAGNAGIAGGVGGGFSWRAGNGGAGPGGGFSWIAGDGGVAGGGMTWTAGAGANPGRFGFLNGNVGIGTASPSGVLDVVGSPSAPTDALTSIFLRAGTTLTSGNGGSVQISGGAGSGAGNGGSVQINGGSTTAGTGGNLSFSAGEGAVSTGGNLAFSAGGGRGSGGNITFSTGTASLGGAGSFTFMAANGGQAGGSFIFQTGTGASTNGVYKFLGVPTGTGTALLLDINNNMVKLSSSRRYKNSITELRIDPDAVLKLRPVSFKWNTTGVADIGLIAEDVDSTVKELVIYDKDGKPDGVKYDRLAIYLLDLIKDQQRLIDRQRSELLSLAARVKALETTMPNIDTIGDKSTKEQSPRLDEDQR